MEPSNPTRRAVLGTAAAVTAFSTVATHAARSEQPSPAPVIMRVNGKPVTLKLEPRTTLLDALREQTDMHGTKKGCDMGSCGACTVHVDGKRVLSCLTLAVRCVDKEIITIEGIADGEALHPMQAAFLAHDGMQCGYCTPGQIMSAVALVKEGHTRSDAEIAEWMSGNICRCGAYPNIVAAIREVAGPAGEKS